MSRLGQLEHHESTPCLLDENTQIMVGKIATTTWKSWLELAFFNVPIGTQRESVISIRFVNMFGSIEI